MNDNDYWILPKIRTCIMHAVQMFSGVRYILIGSDFTLTFFNRFRTLFVVPPKCCMLKKHSSRIDLF